MKVIAVSILSLILVIAASGIGIAKVHIKSRPTATAEPCVGLSCWPPEPRIKHRPTHQGTLSPVW